MSTSIRYPVLALVMCGNHMEVALKTSSAPSASVIRLVGGVARRSSLLMAAVDLVVEDAGVDQKELGTILVTRGPGSFTGIRAGLATAMGLQVATQAESRAYSSLLTQAARVREAGVVWAAQPGRRGEIYAQRFQIEEGCLPRPGGPIRIVAVDETPGMGPWVASGSVSLADGAERVATEVASSEALIRLGELGAPSDALEPLYVEGPPVHSPAG